MENRSGTRSLAWESRLVEDAVVVVRRLRKKAPSSDLIPHNRNVVLRLGQGTSAGSSFSSGDRRSSEDGAWRTASAVVNVGHGSCNAVRELGGSVCGCNSDALISFCRRTRSDFEEVDFCRLGVVRSSSNRSKRTSKDVQPVGGGTKCAAMECVGSSEEAESISMSGA